MRSKQKKQKAVCRSPPPFLSSCPPLSPLPHTHSLTCLVQYSRLYQGPFYSLFLLFHYFVCPSPPHTSPPSRPPLLCTRPSALFFSFTLFICLYNSCQLTRTFLRGQPPSPQILLSVSLAVSSRFRKPKKAEENNKQKTNPDRLTCASGRYTIPPARTPIHTYRFLESFAAPPFPTSI